MTGPPLTRPHAREAVGAGPLGETMAQKSAWVKVVNAPWNGQGFIKRKVAEFYVKEGRAEIVGSVKTIDGRRQDLVRMSEFHPKNQAAARRAALGYERVDRQMTRAEMKHVPIIEPRRSRRGHGALGRITTDKVLFRQNW